MMTDSSNGCGLCKDEPIGPLTTSSRSQASIFQTGHSELIEEEAAINWLRAMGGTELEPFVP
jgi:hypothetical protein